MSRQSQPLFAGYALAVASTLLAAWLRLLVHPFVHEQVPFVTFFLAVVVTAWYGGFGPTLLAVMLSISLAAHYFISPANALLPDDATGWIVMTLFACFGLAAAVLGTWFRQKTLGMQAAEDRERLLLAEAATANAKFRAFFEQGPLFAGIMALDGTIIEANRLSLEACGYTREQVVGKPFWECPWWTPSPALMDQIKAACGQASLGETFRAEMPYFVADGSQRTVDIIILPIMDETGRVLFVAPTGTDITERKEAEERLKESESRFRNMADNAPVIIWITDPAGHCTYLNKQWYDFTGTTPGQGLAFGWLQSIYPEDRAATKANFSRAHDKRESFRVEYRLRRHDGEYRNAIAAASPRVGVGEEFLGYIGSVIDVTELKRVEGDRQKLAVLAETSTDFIGMCDKEFLPFFINRAGLEMMGLNDMEQARHVPVREFFFPEDRAKIFDEFFPSVLDAGHGETEVRFRHFQTGRAIWMLYRVFILTDDRGQRVGLATVSRDITDRKRLEDDLRKLAADLKDADRRKDEFLAMLAHELRNPLAPIRMGLDLLAMEEDRGQSETIQLMQEQLEHLIRLVDDLLDVSRIMRGKVELRRKTVELSPLLEQSVNASRARIDEHQQDLVVSMPEQRIWLHADPVRLVQVLENLLNNASKYTEAQGRIEMIAESQGNEVLITVRDTGVGIEPELLPRIFDLFAQSTRSLDRAQGGLGIGLTLVQNLVHMHGGTVSVQSDGPGRGSTFRVRLPLAVAAGESDVVAQPRPTIQKCRVAVVDDNKGSAWLLSELITRFGDHEIITAHDGPTALAKIREARPHVVLLDIGLPGMDGYQVARELRTDQEFDDVLLVALTGYGQEEDRRKSKEVGFDEHLVKPPSVEHIEIVLAHPKLRFAVSHTRQGGASLEVSEGTKEPSRGVDR